MIKFKFHPELLQQNLTCIICNTTENVKYKKVETNQVYCPDCVIEELINEFKNYLKRRNNEEQTND